MRFGLQIFAVLAIAFAVPAVAQMAPEVKLKTVEQDIVLSERRKSEIAAEIASAVLADEKITAQLITLARDITAQQRAVATTQAKLEDLKKEDIILRSALADKREVLSELLAGLQLLEGNPPPALIVNPDDILGALRSAMVFGAVVPELKDEAVKLSTQLQRLKTIKKDLIAAQETAENQTKALLSTEVELKSLQDEKQTLLIKAKLTMSDEESTLITLTNKAKTLRDLLTALVTARVMETNRLTLEAKEAARIAALKAKPMMRLSEAKGRLNYPIEGEIIRNFGEDNGLGAKMTGLALAGLPDSIVISPVDGAVKFAGPFRSLHELVILDTGDNMTVMLGGFDRVEVKTGQTIRAGEPVGRLGRKANVTAFMDTGLGGDRPLLYVEFFKNGAPIDSTPWWVGAVKEAKSK